VPGARRDLDALRAPLGELPDPLPVPALIRSPRPPVEIRPPGSKSLTNRAVILAALADGTSRLRGALLDAEDADVMVTALRALGCGIEREDRDLVIKGVGGRWRPRAPTELNLANSGTSVRFLAAAALLSSVPLTIDGSARMRERPIAQLADLLTQLGASVEHHAEPGFPPLTITPPTKLPRCAELELPELESSQYLTALLLIAPWLPGGVTLTSRHTITSGSYARLTLGLLDSLGASVRMSESLGVIRVGAPGNGPGEPAGLRAFELDIEPDASGATYFWAAGALGASCAVVGIPRGSLQPDARLPDLLMRMGCRIKRGEGDAVALRPGAELLPIMADLSEMPDAAMTLAVVAAFASGRSQLSGLETLRIKETDRIDALQTELAKLNVRVETPVLGDDGSLAIEPPPGGVVCSPDAPRVEFDTYNDHRMAMALSLVCLRRPNTLVRNPSCVAKTYPQYWADLADILE